MTDKRRAEMVPHGGPIIISGGRQVGKTTRLIELAAETDQYIVEPTRMMADYVFRMAHQMGYDIRNPVSVAELQASRLDHTPYAATHPYGGVLIDEAQEVLRMALHLPSIMALAICTENYEVRWPRPERGDLEW
ncbi:MAG: hypothetical protein Q3963_05120 [Coriobacteriaceae bacterium]|nr:hypothetical protein [Coriobacteriaceae bacterium]